MKKTIRRNQLKGAGLNLERDETRSLPYETGTVTRVYPSRHVCDVSTDTGRILYSVSWPGAPKRLTVPLVGDHVLISYRWGGPTIQYATAEVQVPVAAGNALSGVVDISTDTVVNPSDTIVQPSFAGRGIRDLVPGDDVLTNLHHGNYLGVLSGGTCRVFSSEFSSITTNKIDDVTTIIGRTLNLFSGAGSLVMNTDDLNKTSLELSLGADEETESSPDRGGYRIRASLGQTGDVAIFRITDPEGRDKFSVDIRPDGVVHRTAAVDVQTVAELKKIMCGELVIDSRGKESHKTVGPVSWISGGSHTLNTAGKYKVKAASNIDMRSGGEVSINAGSGLNITSNGGLTPLPTNQAFSVLATNGHVLFDIGSPLAGDFGLVRSGFNVQTNTGDIVFGSTGGTFSVDTLLPVKLGGPAIIPPGSPYYVPRVPGPFRAVLFEPLAALLMQMGILLDAHMHGPPGSPPLTAGAFSSLINSTLALIAAKFVTFGG